MSLTERQRQFVDALRSHKHTQHQLRMKVQSLPRMEQFGALLHMFTGSNHYGDQQISGRLLIDLAPECPDSLGDILHRIAPTWNPSVEELPFYLSDVSGPAEVVDAAHAKESEFAEDARERRAMETVAWWLKGRSQDSARRSDSP